LLPWRESGAEVVLIDERQDVGGLDLQHLEPILWCSVSAEKFWKNFCSQILNKFPPENSIKNLTYMSTMAIYFGFSIIVNLNLIQFGFIRKFRPKRFHKTDSRRVSWQRTLGKGQSWSARSARRPTSPGCSTTTW
jgi:hypothetical protein